MLNTLPKKDEMTCKKCKKPIDGRDITIDGFIDKETLVVSAECSHCGAEQEAQIGPEDWKITREEQDDTRALK